jgi:hypothetical protein
MTIITLEGVALEWLETPQGRKRASRIFRHNTDKLALLSQKRGKSGLAQRSPERRRVSRISDT